MTVTSGVPAGSGGRPPVPTRKPPGYYGKNAYYTWKDIDGRDAKALQNPALTAEARAELSKVVKSRALRYTPPGSLHQRSMYDNAFGYADHDIFHRDNNFDRVLDMADLMDGYLFSGPNGETDPQAEEKAWHEMLIKDRNGDRVIDGMENAAFILLTDNITEMVAQRYEEILADPAQRQTYLKSPQDDKIRTTIQNIRQRMPSKFDGQLTWNERFVAYAFTRLGSSISGIIGELLDRVIAQHNLTQRYMDFKRREDVYRKNHPVNPANFTVTIERVDPPPGSTPPTTPPSR